MEDLRTETGRLKAISKIEKEFISNLNSLIPNKFSEKLCCTIINNSIELGIATSKERLEKGFKMEFASEVTLYAKSQYRKENEINFSSSGSFSPKNESSFWRTIHASIILTNWELVTDLVNKYCKIFRELEKQIFDTNKY